MVEWKYSYVPKDLSKAARAYGINVPISYKHAVLIAKAIRGKKLEDAYKYLDDVIAQKKFIPFVKFNKSRGHKPRNAGIDGSIAGPGGYPIKACGEFLKVLKSAEKNAEKNINLDIKNLKISHISALKGRTIIKLKPKGRRAIWKKTYVHIQVVLEEEEPTKKINKSEKSENTKITNTQTIQSNV